MMSIAKASVVLLALLAWSVDGHPYYFVERIVGMCGLHPAIGYGPHGAPVADQ